MALDWPRVSTLPWRERNTLVEAAVREYLVQSCHEILDSAEIAFELWPSSRPSWHHLEVSGLTRLLTRLAPHMHGLATHDGETITCNGKTWRRWRWHGQKREN